MKMFWMMSNTSFLSSSYVPSRVDIYFLYSSNSSMAWNNLTMKSVSSDQLMWYWGKSFRKVTFWSIWAITRLSTNLVFGLRSSCVGICFPFKSSSLLLR